MQKLAVIGILTIFLLVLLNASSEQFATKEEKATALYNWFKNERSPTYISFRKAFNDRSNIVEYEHLLALAKSGKLTLGAVRAAI